MMTTTMHNSTAALALSIRGGQFSRSEGEFSSSLRHRVSKKRASSISSPTTTLITRAQKQGTGTRPYTLRSGDTLESIASKRKLNVETLKNMNKKIGPNPKIGETILIPSGALSARDLEIINGIAKINAPRTYVPRKGETIGDVITARKIDFAEVQKLNPDVKLGTFSGKESLKLPPGKYTVREREMLQGCGILPPDAVSIKLPGAESARNILITTVLIGAYSMYFAACRRYQKYGTKLFGNDREEDDQD
jgi:LysM repeat protein